MQVVQLGKNLFIKHRTVVLYGLIGLSAIAVDLVLYAIGYNALNFEPTIATIISVTIATLWSFAINARHNFKVTDKMPTRLTWFFGVSLFGMIVSFLVIKWLYGDLGINANVAKIISLPPIVVVQYLINSAVTFKHSS